MQGKFRLEEAEKIAEELKEKISPYVKKVEIVGSIRRRKPEVHDIDIVVVGKFFPQLIKGLKVTTQGQKIIRGIYRGIPVDIYVSDEDSFEVIKLIRTGSADFNKRLCTIAKQRGWKLYAGGKGLVDMNGRVIAKTERGIIEALLGKYVPPEERE